MFQHFRTAAALCVAILCALPAASLASAPAAANPATVTVLRIGMPDTSIIVDPAMVADEQNAELAELLYSGLVRLDPSYHVVNDAASRYTVSRDRRTYTFYLRRDMRFSNGDPVEAQDFRFSIQRSLSPALKSPTAPSYLLDIQGAYEYLTGKAKSVAGLKVVDTHTLRITTRWPIPYFPMELTYPTSFALDHKIFSKLGSAASTSWYANPVGSGPYRLKSWTAGSKIELARNKYYPGPRSGLKQVSISLAPLPDSGVYQYISHAVDVMNLPTYDHTLLHQPGIRETTTLAIDGIYMNFHHKPFNQAAVRKALTLSLNRTGAVSRTMKGLVTPFQGYVPAGEAGYDPWLKVMPYNPAQARALLKAAGFTGGKHFPPMTLYYYEDPAVAKLAKAIVLVWHQNLHITVDTQALTLNTLFAKVQSNSLPLYIFGWSADYPDPHDWLSLQWETGALNNNVRYHNATFDKLVQTADVTWPYSQRMSLYNQAQQVLVNDGAWIPLYIPHRLVYLRPTVQNLSVTGYGIIPRAGSWGQVEVRAAAAKPHSAE